MVEPGVPEVFLDTKAGESIACYVPRLLATARLHWVRGTTVDAWATVSALAAPPEGAGGVAWGDAVISLAEPTLAAGPAAGAVFGPLPATVARAAAYRAFERSFVDWLRRSRPLVLWHAPAQREYSRPGESEAEFRGRLAHAGREARDHDVEAVRKRWAARLARAEEAVRRAEARGEREEQQYEQQKAQTLISAGATVLGVLLGRRRMGTSGLGRATTTVRQAARIGRERDDVAQAAGDVTEARRRLGDVAAACEAELRAAAALPDPASIELREERVALRRDDIDVLSLALAWQPVAAERA